jgi:hypothetical protein
VRDGLLVTKIAEAKVEEPEDRNTRIDVLTYTLGVKQSGK